LVHFGPNWTFFRHINQYNHGKCTTTQFYHQNVDVVLYNSKKTVWNLFHSLYLVPLIVHLACSQTARLVECHFDALWCGTDAHHLNCLTKQPPDTMATPPCLVSYMLHIRLDQWINYSSDDVHNNCDFNCLHINKQSGSVASFPGLLCLQFLIAYCKQSKTGGVEGLGTRLAQECIEATLSISLFMYCSAARLKPCRSWKQSMEEQFSLRSLTTVTSQSGNETEPAQMQRGSM